MEHLFERKQEADVLFEQIKALGGKRQHSRKAYVSPYAKFDKMRRKR